MKKKSAKHSIYCGILSAVLLGSSLPMLAIQVHAEEKTKVLGGSVGGLVWEDFNQNGIQDAGEKGIEGITIELYRTDNSKVGEQKTDQNGFYQFNALEEGDYVAHIVIPQDQYKMVSTRQFGWDGWTGYFHIKGDEDNKLDADVGLFSQKGKIGETIWEDTNQNGIQDAGEPGISGVTLELYNISGEKIQGVTTDEKGHYQFTNIPNGYYYVRLQTPEGYDFLGSSNFGADKLSNYILVEGKQNNGINAGFIKKSKEISVESIKIAQDKIDTTEGQTGTIRATVQPENATNKTLMYKSKDPNVVTVDKDGNWKAVKEGSTTLTVTSTNGKTAKVFVTVKKQEVDVQSIKLATNRIETKKGKTGTIQASVQPENASNKTLTYESKNPNIVTVDQDGNWKAIGNSGITTIIVTSSNGKTAVVTMIVAADVSINSVGLENGYHRMVVSHSGKALTQGLQNGQPVLAQFSPNGRGNQEWIFRKVGSNYTIQNRGSGQYIADSRIPTIAGTKAILSNTPGYFKVDKIDTNRYVIKNATNGYILDMPDNNMFDQGIFQFFRGWSYYSTNEVIYITRV